MTKDVQVENHGSLFLIRPQSHAAQAWIQEHVLEPTYFGEALVVEPRYVAVLTEGMIRDGLRVA